MCFSQMACVSTKWLGSVFPQWWARLENCSLSWAYILVLCFLWIGPSFWASVRLPLVGLGQFHMGFSWWAFDQFQLVLILWALARLSWAFTYGPQACLLGLTLGLTFGPNHLWFISLRFYPTIFTYTWTLLLSTLIHNRSNSNLIEVACSFHKTCHL